MRWIVLLADITLGFVVAVVDTLRPSVPPVVLRDDMDEEHERAMLDGSLLHDAFERVRG